MFLSPSILFVGLIFLPASLGFGIPSLEVIHAGAPAVPPWCSLMTAASSAAIDNLPSIDSNSAAGAGAVMGLFAQYKEVLDAHPLQTKMITGAVVATMGDAVAQFSAGLHAQHTKTTQEEAKPETEIELDGEGFELEENDDHKMKFEYDAKRAVAFAAFDSVYRFAQHVLYPPVIEHFRGQYILWVLGTFEIWPSNNIYSLMPDFFAALEESLVAQLVIVPLIYYPVFYAVTGLIQNLTVPQTIERAKETFVPLMKRNLLFWIPVQFAVFGFVEENLQVPALSLCSLVWVIILSFFAGSTSASKSGAQAELEEAVADAVVHDVEQLYKEALDEGVVAVTRKNSERAGLALNGNVGMNGAKDTAGDEEEVDSVAESERLLQS